MKVLISGDSWFGVTYREDKEFVRKGLESLIRAGVYPEQLFPVKA